MKNLYQTLGLDSTASADEIQQAYKEFAGQYEPHRHANSAFFTERFKEVLNAYEILRDPVRRQEYDAEYRTVAEWKQRTREIEDAWVAARDRGEVKSGPPRAGRGAAGFLGFLLGLVVTLAGGWAYLHFLQPPAAPAVAVAPTVATAPDADAGPPPLARRLNRLLDAEKFAQSVQVADSALKLVTPADSGKIDPERGRLLFLRAIAKQSIKNDTGALRDYSASIRAGGRGAAVYNNRGMLRQDKGDVLRAEQDFWLAVGLEPKVPLFHLNLGALQLEQKNFAQAERQLSIAAEADPTNAEAWLLLGNARYSMQQIPGACEAWQKGAELGFEPAIENAQQFCR